MGCGENFSWLFKDLKVNKSLYKQSEVTQHFSTGQNLLKMIFKKDKC